MDRRKDRIHEQEPAYHELPNDTHSAPMDSDASNTSSSSKPFSLITYSVFLLLGIAMLWAWNMFMAAAPYFQLRFRTSKPILNNFQAAELSVSTVANLGSVFVLAKLQANASYPRRIISSLLINIVTFTFLALSTRVFLSTTAGGYLAFLMIMVLATSLATGFMQNGAFAYVAGFGRPEYMQAIMFGQAVAGVLPPIVQISSVLSAGEAGKEAGKQGASTSAFAYFLTATGVSALTLLAFFFLLTTRRPEASKAKEAVAAEPLLGEHDAEDDERAPLSPKLPPVTPEKKSVPLTYLARRLLPSASAVFLTFAITMVFPVFTQEIVSTNPNPPPLLGDAAFIPLGLLVWNVGDLIGRLMPLVSRISLAKRPKILFVLSVARLVFIPLYLLCNIVPAEEAPEATVLERARTAMPDAFYLLIVQLPFGLSNGYLGSCCMMGAGELVDEEEREAAGAFMGMCLVAGLAVGSLASFFVGG